MGDSLLDRACCFGAIWPLLMRTLQVNNMNQNCKDDKLSLFKHIKKTLPSQQKPKKYHRKDIMLCPDAFLPNELNVYHKSVPLSPSSNKSPNFPSNFFKEWSWQRKFFTWLGELLAGSGPKWRWQLLDGKTHENCQWKERVFGLACCVFFVVLPKKKGVSGCFASKREGFVTKNCVFWGFISSRFFCIIKDMDRQHVQNIPKSEIRIHIQDSFLLINKIFMWSVMTHKIHVSLASLQWHCSHAKGRSF